MQTITGQPKQTKLSEYRMIKLISRRCWIELLKYKSATQQKF